MDLRVDTLAAVRDRLGTVVERLGELQAGPRVRSDAHFSDPFVADHTEFDSFEAFREQSPGPLDADADVPRDRLDEYVAATTDFETVEQMETLAAAEEIVDQVVS